MTYAYNSKIYLAEAVLNVKDLAPNRFLHQHSGVGDFVSDWGGSFFGAGGKPLVHLIQTVRTGVC